MRYLKVQSTGTHAHTHTTHTQQQNQADLLLVRTCSCGNSAAAKHELQMHAKPRVPASVVQLTSDSGTKRVVAISHPFDAYFVSLFVVIKKLECYTQLERPHAVPPQEQVDLSMEDRFKRLLFDDGNITVVLVVDGRSNPLKHRFDKDGRQLELDKARQPHQGGSSTG